MNIYIIHLSTLIPLFIYSLYDAKCKLAIENSDIYAQRKLIDSLKAYNWMPVNETIMRNEMRNMEIRNSNVLELQYDKIVQEVEYHYDQIIDKYIEAVIYESNKDKITRAKKRHQYLQNIANVISDGLMNAECLWILMQIDLGRLQKRQSIDGIIETYTVEAKQCRRRCVCIFQISPDFSM